jgi:lysophospholipase L1-like esterase
MSLRVLVVSTGLMLVVACGKTPTDPPPPPAAPTVLCPISSTIESPDNVPMPVTFAVPTATGGQAPVAVTCTAQSGASFPLGSTVVTCTATDALQRQASCNFNIAITATPRISKTTFLAFGDSITEGTKSDPLVAVLSRPHTGLFALGESHSYPFKLSDMLTSRYRSQTITVVNEGWPGETVSLAWAPLDGRPIGELRLPGELQKHGPDVLLLMEGTNDLYFSQDKPSPNGIPDIIAALGRMVDEAQNRGIEVFIATVPPVRPGNRPDRTGVAPLIPLLNDEIRSLAAQKGATLVDLFAVLNQNLNLYIGWDDLHPTDAGFTLIADTFVTAIRQKLDVTPASTFGLR